MSFLKVDLRIFHLIGIARISGKSGGFDVAVVESVYLGESGLPGGITSLEIDQPPTFPGD